VSSLCTFKVTGSVSIKYIIRSEDTKTGTVSPKRGEEVVSEHGATHHICCK
jgi:hypothetical protein